MSEKSNVYEVVNHSNDGSVMATLWWDGKSIQSDNPSFLGRMKRLHINGKTFADGPEFLAKLKYHYNNGYIMVRRAKSE